MNKNEVAVSKLLGIGFEMPGIRKAILALNSVTNAEVARSTGIHVASVKKYIGGSRYKLENQKKIAGFFEVPADIFFCDVHRPS